MIFVYRTIYRNCEKTRHSTSDDSRVTKEKELKKWNSRNKHIMVMLLFFLGDLCLTFIEHLMHSQSCTDHRFMTDS
jgi:hypothetical protein